MEGVFTSGRCTVSYGPKPYGFEPKAILKAINRYCRRRRIFEGGLQWGYDYATWSVCYPQMAREFNRAAAAIMGRPGRYLPIIR